MRSSRPSGGQGFTAAEARLIVAAGLVAALRIAKNGEANVPRNDFADNAIVTAAARSCRKLRISSMSF